MSQVAGPEESEVIVLIRISRWRGQRTTLTGGAPSPGDSLKTPRKADQTRVWFASNPDVGPPAAMLS